MDDDQPVTRREFREVTEQLQSSINDTRSDLGGRIDKVEEKVDKIWDVVLEIRTDLKELKSLPARVERLERDRGWTN